ncbi:amino acid adenylation domain-containing protein [Pseudomonas sp. S31]|uniref:non-ribosomal peptide synthetase n=1 Tax=Pseudomonas sp. S31 TaxID=1564473 RepID=UPI0019115BFC|nr:non-ribosomal peptide synthetase [Pseudomonas sp. S31]MBK4998717.1 amino acid adenylation domain-containing protein [Pseudomonas sp. S31]
MDFDKNVDLVKRFVRLPLQQREVFYQRLLEKGMSFAGLPIPALREGDAPMPASYAQERQWFLWQLQPDSAAYHICSVLRLHGPLQTEALQASLDALVARHESLRTRFSQGEQGILQHRVEQRIVIDPVALEPGLTGAALGRWVEQWSGEPFDLANGPLLRVVLGRVSDDEHVLLLVQHHIISDGFSMQVMVNEWMTLYQGCCSGQMPTLAPLPVQYADYALWQRRWMEAGERSRQLAYWVEKLGSDHPLLELPLDHARGRFPSHQGARVRVSLPAELVESLRSVAKAQGVTLFMLLLATYQVLLHRYSGQEQIRVGVPMANRNRAETQGLLGLFVNTQVLCGQLGPQLRFDQFLGQVRSAAQEAQAHQDLPFEQLVEALQPERSLGSTPLFQAMFNHQMARKAPSSSASGLTLEHLDPHTPSAKVDLTLETLESEAGLQAAFLYRSELFEPASIERLAAHWQHVLQAVSRAPEQPIGEIPLLDDTERGELVRPWQASLPLAGDQAPVHRLFEQQAARVPEALAVVAENGQLTYRELDNNANGLAGRLQAQGVAAGDVVGVMAERSVEFVATVLALMKLGAAYLPLEPGLPAARQAYLLEDAGVRCLVGQSPELAALAPQVAFIAFAVDPALVTIAAPAVAVDARQLAYVMYTSGTTGQPKGVGVSHAALNHYAQAISERLPMPAITRLAMVSTPASDLGHTMFYGALCAGKTLHLLGSERCVDAQAFASYLSEHGIDALKIVPSHLEALMAASSPQAVLPRVCLVVGGESISEHLLARIHEAAPGLSVINHYGPTETTVGVLTAQLEPGQPVTLGAPLSRCRVAVLDPQLQWAPGSAAGELYIGGAGLADGYQGKPGLTAERFVPDPYDPVGGARLYRTGDRVNRLADGRIRYLGRVDQQIKIRGFRVEPGEIVSALQAQPEVAEAAVVALSATHGSTLVAYLVAAGEASDTAGLGETLRGRLAGLLPDYMVPERFMVLPALPLTPNGKLDRKALPVPDKAQARYQAPVGATEQAVAEVWAQVLEVDRVGRTDNFFRLGGHSLLAIQMIARLRQQARIELPLRGLFETSDLAGFAALASGAAPQQSIMPRAPGQAPRLSFAQQRQWVLWQLDPQGAAYNIPTALRLVGPLDVGALQRSFAALIARHETLRTRFEQVDGQPVQVIEAPSDFSLVPEPVEPAQVQAWIDAEAARPFDLETGPLLRARLLRLGADEHVLTLTLHHIVSDGWSTPILVRELVALYEGACQGREVSLAPLPIQYADYAQWQRQWMEAGEQARQLAYWTEQLGDEQPVLELPLDRLRPARSSFRGARLQVPLSPALSQALQGLARERGVTLFMLLLASFQTLLHRYSGQRDIRVGVPIANRNRVETEGLIGFFVNTQVLRAQFDVGLGFDQLLTQVRQAALGAQAHQDLPFEQLVEALQPERSVSHNPLFQVMYNHQSASKTAVGSVSGLAIERLEGQGHVAKFDLSLDSYERDGELSAAFLYSTDLFDAATIERLAGHWLNLLEAVCLDSGQDIASLPLLGAGERRALLQAWDHTGPEIVLPPVHQLFEAQVLRSPEAVAVIGAERQLTYQQLNTQANRLAHWLIEQGVGPESRVAIAMSRSEQSLMAFLAVLKAGGAYVPLDVAYPAERLLHMMRDSRAALVLSETQWLDQLPFPEGTPGVALDQLDLTQYSAANPSVTVAPGNLAYVIYTSGSTGLPKGVAVEHGPLAMHTQATGERYETSPADCELHFMSFAFDGAHEGWMHPLINGARVLVRDDRLWLPDETCAQMHRHGVTIGVFPPIYLQQLAEHVEREGNPPAVRVYCFGGEAVSQASYALARRVLKPTWIFNGYGPTETVVTPLIWKAGVNDSCGAAYAPIGELVGHRSGYVLDDGLGLQPQGLAGELYLGGQGVARGYLDRPGLTAERFVPDPYGAPGARLYRSGDQTRCRGDGLMEYLSRVDHQVKVRGFRIELGEVEARLLAHPQVREAVVLAQDGPAGKQLVGYVVVSQDVQGNEIRQHLKTLLPDYMVPSHVLVIPALPLTPNGKLDRKALPLPDVSALQQGYVAPRNDTEAQLAAVWADVLKLERVGLEDNFFELGGDSIMSIQVVSRARQQGLQFTPKELFEHQTVGELAQVVRRGGMVAIDQGLVTGQAPLTPIQSSFVQTAIPHRDHWNQAVMLAPREPLQASVLEAALQALLSHHDALRARLVDNGLNYDGPVPSVLWQREALDDAALAEVAEQAQRSLNLADGQLLRAVLIERGAQGQRLLLVVHHLVIDGVSWRIVLEDLQQAYTALAAGRTPGLPAKSDAFKTWATRLAGHALDPATQAESAYWQAALSHCQEALPCDFPEGAARQADAAFVSSQLDATRTRQLLQQTAQTYRTQINDLLLTALSRVVCRWTGEPSALIRLEGHGREDLFDDLDITRTVGWFTSVYPVCLTPQAELGESIKAVKEQLRAVPNKGIGYGMLRYLGDEPTRQALAELPRGQIVFNYLGQFDQAFDESTAILAPSGEYSGAKQDAAAPLPALISINGQVHEGVLQLNWTYSTQVFHRETLQGLANDLTQELEGLIDHCLNPAMAGLTPSDVPLAGLDQAQLDQLPVPAGDIADLYPLSPMQQGMLFHSLGQAQGGAYVNQLRVDVQGLDIERFRAAWQATVDSHEVLRASFLSGQAQALQLIRKQVTLPLQALDWQGRDDLAADLSAFAERDRQRGFDLEHDALLRLTAIQTAPGQHHLIYTNHHILMDGWSNSRLLGEVLQRYAGVQVPMPKGRFRDYIQWLGAQDAAANQAFWAEQLQAFDEPTRLAQAIRQPEGALAPGQGEWHQALDEATTQRLVAFSRQQHLTVNTLVQAAWLLLLHRYTGQAGVSFGATVAGRPAALVGIEEQLGLFINTLPVFAQVRAEQPVAQWLAQLQAQNLSLREHEHTPLYEVQRWAGRAGESLFDTLLVFENYPVAEALQQGAPAGLAFGQVHSREQTNYPMTLAVTLGQQLKVHYSFDRGLFTDAAVHRLGEHFITLLVQLAERATAPVGELRMLSPEEHRQLQGYNDTAAVYPLDRPVHRLIEDQVDRTPDAIALVFGERQLSYRQLNEQANRLARRLRELGVGPDVPVGVAAHRSLEMVIGLLAVLKAGGAYVPMDPEYPIDRLSYMLQDSGVRLLLTQAALAQALPLTDEVQVLCLDASDSADVAAGEENLAGSPSADDLAYIIYTSGSTGRPKGAGNSHRALVNRLCWMQKAYTLDATDAVLQKTPFSFDVSVWEFFWPLITGARLVVAQPGDHRDPQRLLETIVANGITTLHFVPSMLQAFLAAAPVERCSSITRLVCSGEALPPELAQEAITRLGTARLYNLYGPTEAAIDVTHWHCTPEDGGSVPIGVPIDNLRTHVVDLAMHSVPVGVNGELLLGGMGLARGYHRRPALTAERFIPDPFAAEPGGRLYRTGDLVRLRDDGVIDYLGRLDHQVKIRGLRIELGEIVSRMLELDAVREAVVVDVDLGAGTQLAAYVVPMPGHEEQGDASAGLVESITQHLKACLPGHMVPSYLTLLAAMPMSPNGKLDRKALPAPARRASAQGASEPLGAMARQVAEIWAQVLGLDSVGGEDDFFALGGHSLLAVQVLVRLREQLGQQVALTTLFEHPVLADFCAQLTPESNAQDALQEQLAKSLEALKRLSTEEMNELIS